MEKKESSAKRRPGGDRGCFPGSVLPPWWVAGPSQRAAAGGKRVCQAWGDTGQVQRTHGTAWLQLRGGGAPDAVTIKP